MSFGNCGYAFPTTIGAKVAAPDRPAIAYVGDGAWGMSFGEMLTCVREDIPVTAVVFNNGQWGAEKKNQIDFYADRFVGMNLKNPSLAGDRHARWAPRASSVENARTRSARRWTRPSTPRRSGKTTVLEMMVTKELGDPFRRDALKKPKRLLEKYEHTNVE